MKKSKSIFSNLYIILVFAIMYAPILISMVFSFNSARSLAKFEGFSLKWYQELLADRDIISAVTVSLTVAVIA
ncbi:MAG: spermidine/putrescine ABC transporter substrate-binding protein, partial [Lachnospiraceae bacterium]|nr:spermidine/putrescine ABC transporter substrate-binding protein [Lachnospiraceae bacterium]